MESTYNSAETSYHWMSFDHSLFLIPKTYVTKVQRWAFLSEFHTGPAKMVLTPSYHDGMFNKQLKGTILEKVLSPRYVTKSEAMNH